MARRQAKPLSHGAGAGRNAGAAGRGELASGEFGPTCPGVECAEAMTRLALTQEEQEFAAMVLTLSA